MYFIKKSKVAVLLAVLLVLIVSSLWLIKSVGGGITGAVVGTQDLKIQGTSTISNCQPLNLSGETYRLTESVSSVGTCFTIMNHSITLDCSKWGINYGTGGSPSVGINNTGGYDNITIQDCSIAQTSGRGEPIYFLNSSNSTIKYNNISAASSEIVGIRLDNTSDTTIMFNNISLIGADSIGIFINGTRSSNNLLINNNLSVRLNTVKSIMQLGSVFNSLIYNNTFAQITWNRTNLTNNISLALNLNVYLENNLVGFVDNLSSTPLDAAFNLNSSASIEIRNLMYQQVPDLLKGGVRCDNSNDVVFRCNVTYDRVLGVLSANVTSFSNYSSQENDPPNVTIVSPTDRSNFSSNFVNFNVTITDQFSNISNVTFQFSNVSSPFNRTPANHSFTGWGIADINTSIFTEGLQGFRVLANDTYNNTNNSVFINFTVDRTSPNVTINSLNANNMFNASNYSVRSGNVTFNASVFDVLTGVNRVYYWLDNGTGNDVNATAVNQSGNWIVSYNVSTLAEGRQGVRIIANDTVNNINDTYFMNFTVDYTAPNVNIANPANWTNFSRGTYNFNATISDAFLEISTVIFQFSRAGGVTANRTAINKSGTWNFALDLDVLTEGQNIMTVFANDTVNNMNNTQTINFNIDRTAPNITRNFLNNPVDNSNFSIRSSNRTFNASIFDALLQVDFVYFWFDNGTSQDINITARNISGEWVVSYNVSTLAEGKQGVRIIANDTVNNTDDTYVINFTVDYTAPNVNITNPYNWTNFSRGTYNFNATIRDTLLEISTVIFQFSNPGVQTFNRTAINKSGTWNHELDFALVEEGQYIMTVFANDSVNNMNNTQTINFIDDKTAPNITRNFLNNPVDNSNFSIRSSNQTFNASIFDALLQVNFVYFWFDNGTSQDINITARNISGEWVVSYNVSTLAEGKQGVRIIANDTLNNTDDTSVINFTVDYTAPNVNITSPANGTTISGTQVFNARITDSITAVNTVLFSFTNSSSPFNRTASNSSGTWNVSVNTAGIEEGTITVTVFANDTVGNLNSTKALSLTVENVAETSSGGTPAAPTTTPSEPSTPSAPTPSAPTTTPSAPSAPVSSTETASAAEASSSFESGQSSVNINHAGTSADTTYTSIQNYKVTITNNLNKKMILKGTLAELAMPLENEENIKKRLREELLLLEGEVDEATLEEELENVRLLDAAEIFQIHKWKLSHLFPNRLTGAAIAPPLKPTGERINGNLLKDLLLNAEELNFEVDPHQTIDKEVKIRAGLSLNKKDPPQIVFSSGGEEVLRKAIKTQDTLVTGAAVDFDRQNKKLDIYLVFPKQRGGKESYMVEMNINTKAPKTSSNLPLKIKLPFFLNGKSKTVHSEILGPYVVNLERGAILAGQYDTTIKGDYEIVTKIFNKQGDLVAKNLFDITQ